MASSANLRSVERTLLACRDHLIHARALLFVSCGTSEGRVLGRDGQEHRRACCGFDCRSRRSFLHRFYFQQGPVTACLIVHRIKDARCPNASFPSEAISPPRFTKTTRFTADADVTHRRHAIIETVFADLIDGPLVHMPSGKFEANSVCVLSAAIAHDLLRATGVLAGDRHLAPAGRPDARSSISPLD